MIDTLGRILKTFPGDANRARCFNHVVALVAKRVVRQFDVGKGQADAALDEAERQLQDLAKGIDIEERLARANQDAGDDEDDEDVNDDSDETDDLSPEARAELDANTRPVRLVLVKVCHLGRLGAALLT
jgi:hypothetical protein